VITTPRLKDLILLSERGQDITKLADLLTDQARHRFFAMFAPPFLIWVAAQRSFLCAAADRVPDGPFGPVRRIALADVVYDDRWGQPSGDL
jgi:hypothetical protein